MASSSSSSSSPSTSSSSSPSSMVEISLAGVPEQINIPINLIKELSLDCNKFNFTLIHKIVREGTGEMIRMLEAGETDLAFTVTDAMIVGHATNGKQVELVGTYVDSPLVWAVATSSNRTDLSTVEDLFDVSKNKRKPKIGISRIGSGSQTMAQYMCSLHQQPLLNTDAFVVANNIDGLKAGVASGEFDAFLWETFTTKPSFDSGELKKLGEVPTPWTAFSIVAASGARRMSAEKAAAIRERLFPALGEACRIFMKSGESSSGPSSSSGTGTATGTRTETNTGSSDEDSVQRICREFGHTPEDARLWLSRCRYALAAPPSTTPDTTGVESAPPVEVSRSIDFALSRSKTERSVQLLKSIGLLPKAFVAESLWNDSLAAVVDA